MWLTAVSLNKLTAVSLNKLTAFLVSLTMTSLEIAELTGKQHKDLMKAIRKMEPAWEKVQGLKFQLSYRVYNLPNGGTKVVPYYSLTKTECLCIATKFNDELSRLIAITPHGGLRSK
ncbi:MAG: Rha family transcriptional regulator [Bacteroidaceae bacterium]|nr:Rha family transcriptional regulator [Bacteroidaceae bacterium]